MLRLLVLSDIRRGTQAVGEALCVLFKAGLWEQNGPGVIVSIPPIKGGGWRGAQWPQIEHIAHRKKGICAVLRMHEEEEAKEGLL